MDHPFLLAATYMVVALLLMKVGLRTMHIVREVRGNSFAVVAWGLLMIAVGLVTVFISFSAVLILVLWAIRALGLTMGLILSGSATCLGVVYYLILLRLKPKKTK